MGYPSPIHDTIDDTHGAYNRAVEAALEAIARGDKVEILIASHNQVRIPIYSSLGYTAPSHWPKRSVAEPR
jgi:hypothetical protein